MNLVPFESARLPAHIAKHFGVTGPSALSANVGASFPSISIKGKVFHLVRGDEKQLLTRPDSDEPAGSIEAIILDANPVLSRVYYPSGYEEGTAEKPTCYSNNGVGPEADAKEPQAKKCAICPHGQWGSKISEAGKQGKACSDSRRIAIATPDTPQEAILLRVPAASLKPLAQYGDMLVKRGVDFAAVVTKIGFDYTVAHPALTFKAVGFIDEALAAEVAAARKSDSVAAVLGVKGAVAPAPAEPEDDIPQYKAPAPKAAPKEEAEAPAPAPKPVKAKPAPKAEPAPAAEPAVAEDAAAEISDMLAGMSFDD